mmetsp:Transcript_24048/g.58422  ORF Transcript_24048/g.58422 Transcript_24048/m.58422 type:complete len:378 (-) Transcript_24048:1216-2349(-)
MCRLLHHRVDDAVQSGAGAHCRLSLARIGLVVASQVHGSSLALDELVHDLLLVVLQRLSHRPKLGLDLGDIAGRHGLGPVQSQVEVGAPVVDLLDLTRRVLVGIQEPAHGVVQTGSQSCHLGIAALAAQLLQVRLEGQELTQGVPAEVVLLHELLHVLGGGAASTGLVHTATGKQRHNRQHLGTGSKLQNGEQIRVVITQHVTGDTDAVLPLLGPLQRVPARFDGVHEQDLQAAGVVVLEVGLALGLDVAVVGAGLVEPEHRRPASRPRARNRKLHPVLDGNILGLARPPDVAGLDLVFEQDRPVCLHHLHGTVSGGFEGLVVGAVLLGLLGHQSNVRHGAHGGRVECPVGLAELDGLLEHPGVASIRNQRLGVTQV